MAVYKDIIYKKYEDLSHKLNKKMSKYEKYEIEINDKDLYTLNVIHNDEKQILCKYEVIGYYGIDKNFFMWNFGALTYDKKNKEYNEIIKKNNKNIKNIIIENQYKDIDFLEFLLYCVSNNIFYIERSFLDDLLKYICCITNAQGYLISTKENNMIIYLVSDILQM